MNRLAWLVLPGPPGRQFISSPAVRPYLDSSLSVHALIQTLGTLRSQITGENVSVTIDLDNSGKVCTQLFLPRAPLGQNAKIYDWDGKVVSEVFTGVVYSIEFKTLVCELVLQA